MTGVPGRCGVNDIRMAFVEINSTYREFLQRQGLVSAEQFLELPGVVVSGHPERHVVQVRLGEGPSAVRAFLKREHRVPWLDRLSNAWEGFGPVSRSVREACLLTSSRAAGIGCPDVIAWGEDGRGRAFLLIRELTGAQELRSLLRDRLVTAPGQRRRLARRLGEALARMHAAGFDHSDLYSKHVFVDCQGDSISFLDWQRSRRLPRLGWRQRWQTLAALDATLADHLATPRERLACLWSYLHTCRALGTNPPCQEGGRKTAWRILGYKNRLLRRRHVREIRQESLAPGTQNLIWLEGEALCMPREFFAALGGEVPAWLDPRGEAERVEKRPGVKRWFSLVQNPFAIVQRTRTEVAIPGGGSALLIRRWTHQPWRWLWAILRWKRLTSPELKQAGILFRLQRYGIDTPRLLAVGQHHPVPWQTESLLLAEPPADAERLVAWLKYQSPREDEPALHWWVLREVAELLRRMHEACCYLADRTTATRIGPWFVRSIPGEKPVVMFGSVEGIRTRPRPSQTLVRRDLVAALTLLARGGCSRTDQLRFWLAYHDRRRLPSADKRRLSPVLRNSRKAAP